MDDYDTISYGVSSCKLFPMVSFDYGLLSSFSIYVNNVENDCMYGHDPLRCDVCDMILEGKWSRFVLTNGGPVYSLARYSWQR